MKLKRLTYSHNRTQALFYSHRRASGSVGYGWRKARKQIRFLCERKVWLLHTAQGMTFGCTTVKGQGQ